MRIHSIDHAQMMSNPLFHTYLHSFASVNAFYEHDPRDGGAWNRMRTSVGARNLSNSRRAVAQILTAQNSGFGSDETALANTAALAESETLVIATGQQVGLFTGPLYTIYKAITAVKLAERLQVDLGVKVVPVFWMASDDHDFAEINLVTVCPPDNNPITIELRPVDPEDRRSASDRLFGPEITAVLAAYQTALGTAPLVSEIIELLTDACPPDRSLSDGFARLMARLFKGRGLVIVDPTDPALKPLVKSVFERELLNPTVSTQAVRQAADRLNLAGFHPQLDRHSDAVNLFRYEDGQRSAMTYHGGRFHSRNEETALDPDAALELVHRNPTVFSHNVITRPIVQDTLFPGLAYVGGPAEIGYYAQLREVYRQFELPFPVVYPRASLTVIEPRIARILEKHDLKVSDFASGALEMFHHRLRDEMPETLVASFHRIRSELALNFADLGEQVVAVDATLQRLTEAAQRKMEYELDRIEEKTLQALKRSHKLMRDQIVRAETQLYPNRQPQERVANIWGYVATYGFGFMDTLFEAIDVTDFSHREVWL